MLSFFFFSFYLNKQPSHFSQALPEATTLLELPARGLVLLLPPLLKGLRLRVRTLLLLHLLSGMTGIIIFAMYVRMT